ncbi:hypothetical protein THAOC_16316 [Thalassiosira oceanica]|uniref:60S ribosomal protein L6 n=2 Tax=Thalassiosira oceanica TaxID=159749 RepID=K0SDK0_THAOC|nr:hypothetical protein THAOC_16316 [Thalassiosira oceanica]|eukprot:EJK63044.1 hypothetical protein THAOC_16316 [Thalassiosira oceanica]
MARGVQRNRRYDRNEEREDDPSISTIDRDDGQRVALLSVSPLTFCTPQQRVLGVAGPKKAVKASASTGKSARYYPADDVPRPKHSRKKHNPPKVRASFTPGTVCILLSGRFRGKALNQAYVIGTSTKIDVSGVDVSKINDEYFARVESSSEDGEAEFFENDEAKPAIVSDQRKADQKSVDAALMKAVESTPVLKSYLGSKFTLGKHDRPHKMVF